MVTKKAPRPKPPDVNGAVQPPRFSGLCRSCRVSRSNSIIIDIFSSIRPKRSSSFGSLSRSRFRLASRSARASLQRVHRFGGRPHVIWMRRFELTDAQWEQIAPLLPSTELSNTLIRPEPTTPSAEPIG